MDGKFRKYVAKVTEKWNFTEIHKYLLLSYCCYCGPQIDHMKTIKVFYFYSFFL